MEDINDIIKKKNNNLNLILKKSKNKKNIEKPKIALIVLDLSPVTNTEIKNKTKNNNEKYL